MHGKKIGNQYVGFSKIYSLRSRTIQVKDALSTVKQDKITKRKEIFEQNKKIYELRSKKLNTNTNTNTNINTNTNTNINTNTNTIKRSRDDFENNINNEDTSIDEIDIGDFTWDNFNTFSKPQINDSEQEHNEQNDWVSATRVKNSLLKDHCIDWLDMYYKDLGFNDNKSQTQSQSQIQTTTHTQQNTSQSQIHIDKKLKLSTTKDIDSKNQNIFFEMGNKFEQKVIEYLRDKYPTKIKKVVMGYVSPSDQNTTLKYMQEGIPIIEQAALYNYSNRTFGVADLLIRSDWINKLIEESVIPKNMEHHKASKLKGKYHYIVIDIKWSTMHFCANGQTLRNNDRFPAYKGQLAIYNAALGQLQGYTPSSAYILAKSWVIDSVKNKSEGHNCFTKLGHIDFDGFDNKYIKNTFDGVMWIRNVRNNGFRWSCLKPSVPELYPNMCNKLDSPYHGIKKDLAKELNELTEIWMVGPKNREIAHNKNIFSWKNKNCSAKNMGINGIKVSPIVDKIIHINRDSKNLIEPKIITNNDNNWQTETELDFYVDFETLSGTLYDEINILDNKSYNPFLFMIGIGYICNGSWQYLSFTATDVTLEEELRIINEFTNFINSYVSTYNKLHTDKTPKIAKIFHWSHAEKSIMATLNRRHNKNWLKGVIWCDMHKLFLDVPIVIKGLKKFTLKDVAKTMKEHNMIESNWLDNGIADGLTAMIEAVRYYKSKRTDNMLMMHVTNYNEADCKIVWEITHYLRKNHLNVNLN